MSTVPQSAIALQLETIAARAWPAAEVHLLDGWRLRCNEGITRRANSVWPNASGVLPLEERLARVETFYAAREVPSCFQLSAAACPDNLDEFLADRGYEVKTPVHVQTMLLPLAINLANNPEWEEVRITEATGREWFGIYRDANQMGERRERVLRALVGRIGEGSFGIYALCEGEPAAAALGVVDSQWLGIFCMATRPEYRRRGLARQVLAAAAAEGLRRGASTAYLQVEVDNQPAIGLYCTAGFTTAYDYWYREKPLPV